MECRVAAVRALAAVATELLSNRASDMPARVSHAGDVPFGTTDGGRVQRSSNESRAEIADLQQLVREVAVRALLNATKDYSVDNR